MATIFKPKGRAKYVIQYFDEHGRRLKKTGATDKAVTQRLANDLENRVALRREGVVDSKDEAYRDNEARPLADHLADWFKALESKGATTKHVELFTGRARRVVALLLGAKLCEIEPAKNANRADIVHAEATLTKWVASARISDLTAERVQKALATLKAAGRSLATCNHHRAAIKAFSKWCHDTRRAKEDTLRGVTGFNAKEDRRHDRRTVSLDELRRLIEAAERGPEVMGMPGPARSLCYQTAVATGLRYAEIGSILPESFDWEAPSVTVAAGYTKNGDPATLPIPRDLAADLAAYVAPLPLGTPVFPLPFEKGAKMLRVDLEAAGIEYRDASGLVFDFHSLRCEMATLADAAGVSPRVVQRLMRHSSLELTGRYTRPRAVDIDAAAGMIPSLKAADNPSEREVMTGTDSGPGCSLTATQDATHEVAYACNPKSGNIVASNDVRSHNPQVRRSSRLPGIQDGNRTPDRRRRGRGSRPLPGRPGASWLPSRLAAGR